MDPEYEKLMAELQRMQAAPGAAPAPRPDLHSAMPVDASAPATYEHGTPEDRVALGTPDDDPNAAMKAAYRKMARGRTASPDAGTPDITAMLQDLLSKSGR